MIREVAELGRERVDEELASMVARHNLRHGDSLISSMPSCRMYGAIIAFELSLTVGEEIRLKHWIGDPHVPEEREGGNDHFILEGEDGVGEWVAFRNRDDATLYARRKLAEEYENQWMDGILEKHVTIEGWAIDELADGEATQRVANLSDDEMMQMAPGADSAEDARHQLLLEAVDEISAEIREYPAQYARDMGYRKTNPDELPDWIHVDYEGAANEEFDLGRSAADYLSVYNEEVVLPSGVAYQRN
jgi:hypothetical protein